MTGTGVARDAPGYTREGFAVGKGRHTLRNIEASVAVFQQRLRAARSRREPGAARHAAATRRGLGRPPAATCGRPEGD